MSIHALPVRDVRDGSGRFVAASQHMCAFDEAFTMWSVARAEANFAYDDWCTAGGGDAFTVYRAAEDRADAAQDVLARLAA